MISLNIIWTLILLFSISQITKSLWINCVTVIQDRIFSKDWNGWLNDLNVFLRDHGDFKLWMNNMHTEGANIYETVCERYLSGHRGALLPFLLKNKSPTCGGKMVSLWESITGIRKKMSTWIPSRKWISFGNSEPHKMNGKSDIVTYSDLVGSKAMTVLKTDSQVACTTPTAISAGGSSPRIWK